MFQGIIRFVKDEQGVSAVEYGLVAALIAVAIAASVQLLGTNLDTTFSNIATCISGGAC